MKKYNFLKESFLPFGMGFKQAATRSGISSSTMVLGAITGPLSQLRSAISNEEIQEPTAIESMWTTITIPEVIRNCASHPPYIKDACLQLMETIHMNLKMQYNNQTWKDDCIKALEITYIKTLAGHVLTSLGLMAVGTVMDM